MHTFIHIFTNTHRKGARGEMVIVIGNVHGGTSSNPGQASLQIS